MEAPDRSRRIVLVSLAVVTALLPVLWRLVASAGSQEFSDDGGEIRQTLQSAAVLLLLWSVIVGAVVRSLWRSLLITVGVSAVMLVLLGVTLAVGYRTLSPSDEIDHAFWVGAVGVGLRGLGLAAFGTSVGFAIGGIADRLALPLDRPPIVGVGIVVLLLWLGSEAIGWMIPTGRFQLSTHLIGWLDGDWIIYRLPADCRGQPNATCGMYHATWQRSLPVLVTVAVAAVLVGGAARAVKVPAWR
ncbi:hypothetical protein ACQP26_12520 [Micromonospora sp. CA-248089]|uniref:hypothetical protein n=1 Tax=Micromonospora sp. CA-248089 TaxID=3239960 RepID=UPI003D91649F